MEVTETKGFFPGDFLLDEKYGKDADGSNENNPEGEKKPKPYRVQPEPYKLYN